MKGEKVVRDIMVAWYSIVIVITFKFFYSIVEVCRHYYLSGWNDHVNGHFTALVWSTAIILLWRHGFYAQWYTWLRSKKSREALQTRRRNDIPMRKWGDDE